MRDARNHGLHRSLRRSSPMRAPVSTRDPFTLPELFHGAPQLAARIRGPRSSGTGAAQDRSLLAMASATTAETLRFERFASFSPPKIFFIPP